MHLGEKGLWCKWTLFEESTRVPLIISDPRHPVSHGKHYRQPVELLDIFPTLVDLTGTRLENTEEECNKDVNFGQAISRNAAKAEKKRLRLTALAAAAAEVERNRASSISSSSSSSSSSSRSSSSSAAEEGVHSATTHPPAPSFALAPPAMDADIVIDTDRDELGNLTAIEHSLRFESPVTARAGGIFRHIYCDTLEGTSLARIIRGEEKEEGELSHSSSSSSRRPFSITQRMTCKTPGHVVRYPQEADNNVTTGGWIDHCPNKKLPRVPSQGAMGYSLRYVDYRYTAWLHWDADSFLPLLHLPPLAEELYYHDPQDNLHLSRAYKAELTNLAPQAAQRLQQQQQQQQEEGISSSSSSLHHHAEQLSRVRLDLYDFLWDHTSFKHLFHNRLLEQAVVLREMKTGRRVDATRRKAMYKDLQGILHGRVGAELPKNQHRGKHYYSSAASRSE
jgi:hypothetical protein